MFTCAPLLLVPIAAAGAETDPHFANVVSLLHFNGADGSNTFTDVKGKIWTASGNAQLDTAQLKFGTASGLFDGVSDYISTGASADFAFGTGDFTVECWVRPDVSPTNAQEYLVGNYVGATTGRWGFLLDATRTKLQFRHADTTVISQNATINVSAWNHVAVTRASGTLRLFVGGTQLAADLTFADNLSASAIVAIGSTAPNFPNDTELKGWIDDMRITKGVARYTGNFAVPTTQFPDS